MAEDVRQQVVDYLKQTNMAENLNKIVNEMCKQRLDDPYAYLAQEAKKLAKPVVIEKVVGREILDSRANPTVQVDVYANIGGESKLLGRSGAPSGASTGVNEATELRDGDKTRYMGKGVLNAVANVAEKISPLVKGRAIEQVALDRAMIAADGTPQKTTIGGNSMTAASFAFAEAGAKLADIELFLYLAKVFNEGNVPQKFTLPNPMANILNGGKHAGGNLKIQEFMIIPKKGIPFREGLRNITQVYHHLGALLVKQYGVSARNLGDEGGFAPCLNTPEEALSIIEAGIKAAGFEPGQDIFMALDCAASEYYDEEKKLYEVETGKFLTPDELLSYYGKMIEDHPAIISIEDAFAEQDYDSWIKFTAAYGSKIQIVGDDLYTTNPVYIAKGIEEKWANSLLLKVNQIGTITESMDAAKMIFNAKQNVIVSHRSGETASSLIADLSVAIGAQMIKTGAPARGERVSKYNRLLEIEDYLTERGMYQL